MQGLDIFELCINVSSNASCLCEIECVICSPPLIPRYSNMEGQVILAAHEVLFCTFCVLVDVWFPVTGSTVYWLFERMNDYSLLYGEGIYCESLRS